MELDTVTAFTPWASLFGGVLIGAAAVMVMALLGRIAGIAGITQGLVATVVPGAGGPADRGWRIAFLGGLLAAPVLWLLATGAAPDQTVPDRLGAMALAGLLVGIGTAYGSGCTSGHGVCGLARLSRRSAVAVGIFMAAAVVTVFVLRHVIEVG
jgi:uncharacterized membrane protein YedE/YeeE